MAEKEVFNLTKLDGKNFALWKYGVLFLFEAQDLIRCVNETDGEPDRNADDKAWTDWKKRQSRTAVILLSSVEQSLHVNLINCMTPAAIWKKLHALYGDMSEDAKQHCWQQFYEFRIKDGEPVATQIERFETICKKLDDAGEKPSDVAVMSKLLSSLPSRFSAFTMAWECTVKNERKRENLIARIIREDRRLTTVENEETSLALQVKNLQMKIDSESKSNSNHNNTKKKKKLSSRKIEELKKKSSCKYCHEVGHWYRECKKRIADEEEKDGKKEDGASGTAYVCDISAFFSETTDKDDSVWLADSGASMHMTFRREFFRELGPVKSVRFVKVAGDRVLPVAGVGTIDIQACVNNKQEDRQLKEVLFIPDLNRNLFSVGAITNKFSFHVYRDRCEVRGLDGVLSAEGVRHGHLFRMCFTVKKPIECNLASDNSLRLWHERLGHINVNAIKETESRGAVNGIKIEGGKDRFFCEACTLGKHAKKPHFPSKRERNRKPGEMIHSDVCGPINIESARGSRYFLLFKDDSTGFRTVYFIRHKAEVFEKFKEFEALVYRQTDNKIKILRTDNGTEYMSKEFSEFLRTRGIVHETSTPYVPQQNGRVEREMRTIVESARSMLIGKKCPKMLWAEAVKTATYVLNRTLSKQVDGTTAYEKWFGRKPEIKHIRVFGCEAFKSIPKGKRKKFDEKSDRMIFVGYNDESLNYRLWDPVKRKIHVSCDVIFNEESEPKWNEKEEQKETKVVFGNYDRPEPEEEMEEHPEERAGIVPHEEAEEIPEREAEEDADVGAEEDEEDVFEEAEEPRAEEAALPQQAVEARSTERVLRDRRKLKSPDRYSEFGYAFAADSVPLTYESALESAESNKWQSAMCEEMNALKENKTWTLEKPPNRQKIIGCKWVYTLKTSDKSKRYKARLVAKGFSQREGIDYSETFAPVVRYESIRMLLAIAAKEDLEIAQFDVKTAFLYGNLKEDIFMEQPRGFEDPVQPDAVCKLHRSLYGLKQSPRCWNEKFVRFLKTFNLCQTRSDHCVFTGKVNGVVVFLALYVDDGLLISASKIAITEVLMNLQQNFQITVGNAEHFVGIEIKRNRYNRTIKIGQSLYIQKILERFRMEDSKPVSVPAEPGLHLTQLQLPDEEDEKKKMRDLPYREAIGSLLFIARISRPDIEYAVNQASQFLTNYGHGHWQAVKRIFRYLKGTINYGIVYGNSGSLFRLCGYTDADYAGCINTRKSTSGFVFMLNEGAISWSSHKQRVVALSTTESEYIAISAGAKDAIWLRRLLIELGFRSNKVPIHVDNQSAIRLVNNPEYHKRTKHIDVRFHFIRDIYERGEIDVKYVRTNEQLADVFTKPIAKQQFLHLIEKIGVSNKPY